MLTTAKHPITCCGKKSSLLQRGPLEIVNKSKEACIKTRLDNQLPKSGRAGLMIQKRLIYPINANGRTHAPTDIAGNRVACRQL